MVHLLLRDLHRRRHAADDAAPSALPTQQAAFHLMSASTDTGSNIKEYERKSRPTATSDASSTTTGLNYNYSPLEGGYLPGARGTTLETSTTSPTSARRGDKTALGSRPAIGAPNLRRLGDSLLAPASDGQARAS